MNERVEQLRVSFNPDTGDQLGNNAVASTTPIV